MLARVYFKLISNTRSLAAEESGRRLSASLRHGFVPQNSRLAHLSIAIHILFSLVLCYKIFLPFLVKSSREILEKLFEYLELTLTQWQVNSSTHLAKADVEYDRLSQQATILSTSKTSVGAFIKTICSNYI